MMHPKFKILFRRCQEKKYLIEFDRRPQIYERITGFVLDFSDSLILLHLLEWNTFALNGYIVIREQDIKNYRVFGRSDYWQNEAARKNKLKPINPYVSINSFEDCIFSASKSFPLIAIEKELIAENKRFIGRLAGFSSKTVTIHGLNPSAEWIEKSRF